MTTALKSSWMSMPFASVMPRRTWYMGVLMTSMSFLAGLSHPVLLDDFHQLPNSGVFYWTAIIGETPVKGLSSAELVREIG